MKFLEKGLFSQFQEAKMKFYRFCPPWKIFMATPGKIHYCPSLEKNPFGAY